MGRPIGSVNREKPVSDLLRVRLRLCGTPPRRACRLRPPDWRQRMPARTATRKRDDSHTVLLLAPRTNGRTRRGTLCADQFDCPLSGLFWYAHSRVYQCRIHGAAHLFLSERL
jgi:hypothetical protein